MAVSDVLKKKRKEKHLTQVQLAGLSGVSQQAISFIESNRNTPSEGTMRLLANALNCSVAELMGDETGKKDFSNLTHDEGELLTIFNQLNQSGKNMLLKCAMGLLETPEMRQEGSISLMA